MTLRINTHNEDETTQLGKRLAGVLRGGAVVLLEGNLGAGKTRFAKGVASGLGIDEDITSPTFNLVLEYPLGSKEQARVLRHFDLYRLEYAEQLDDLDYFGLLEEEDAISLVEWGAKFPQELPLDYLFINIQTDALLPQQRSFELSAVGNASEEMLRSFALLAAVEGLQEHG